MYVSVSVCCLNRQIHLGINRMIFPPAGSKAAKGWLELLYFAALRRPRPGTCVAPEAGPRLCLEVEKQAACQMGRVSPRALKDLRWSDLQQERALGPPDACWPTGYSLWLFIHLCWNTPMLLSEAGKQNFQGPKIYVTRAHGPSRPFTNLECLSMHGGICLWGWEKII